MIPGGVNELLLRSAGAGGGDTPYTTAQRSVRFNSADSASLSKTFSSTGNRKTYTLSLWCKRSKIGGAELLLTRAGNPENTFRFNSDVLELFQYSGGFTWQLVTTQLFRDPSAWYHILIAFDTTQATSSNRVKLYVNGTQVTTFSTASYPSLNFDGEINTNTAHEIGVGQFNGYVALMHFIDGQALTPSSFAFTNTTTGRWEPKAYSGTGYGTNGFFLDFADNSAATATTLGKDNSGVNSNNWTPNNISVTAGIGNDCLRENPVSVGTNTGVGGEVSGNYCTWNPLSKYGAITLANGNLDANGDNNNYSYGYGTIAMPSGKWYWEMTCGTINAYNQAFVGITIPGTTYISYGYYSDDGKKYQVATGSTFGATFTANDVIGIAFDADNGKIWFSKNGTWQASGNPAAGTNPAYSSIPSANYFPAITIAGGTVYSANWGQRAFAYTAPSGFSPLVDTLLPTPTIAKPNTVMDVLTWTGTGSTRTITTPGGFSPDLLWLKGRSGAYNHRLSDTVRGAGIVLYSDSSAAEGDESAAGITSFTSTGFTLGSSAAYNGNGSTFVGWTWDAGSSNATNTSGTITSTVRANISAGFSVVTYTGTGTTGSVGHGLGVTPSFLILKNRSSNIDWIIYHASAGTTSNYFNFDSAAVRSFTNLFTGISSTTFPAINLSSINASSNNYVAYCWAPVSSYSAFGQYTGNGSSDGPFVYTGFRSRWVLTKRTDTTANWYLHDTARDTYNVAALELYPNSSLGEGTFSAFDINSNGFKLRNSDAAYNASGGTYIYACFAESPLAYARAR